MQAQEVNDDVPQLASEVSLALRARLAREDLSDLEILLRKRGVRTVRSLLALETNDRAVLLSKARQLWEILGLLPNGLNTSLARLFEAEAGIPSLKAGGNSSSSSTAAPSSGPLWAGRVDAGGSRGRQAAQWLELPVPAPDDSQLNRELPRALYCVRDIVGRDRFNEAIRRLNRSTEQAVSSTLEAAEALSALSIRKEEVRDRERKELLKAAKKAVRDVLLWRCFGSSLGLDSREALVRSFEHCCHQAGCDENTVSQLTNGYRRVKEELLGINQPAAGKLNARTTSSPTRKEAVQPVVESIPPTATAVTRAPSVHAGPVARPQDSAPRILPPGYQPTAYTPTVAATSSLHQTEVSTVISEQSRQKEIRLPAKSPLTEEQSERPSKKIVSATRSDFTLDGALSCRQALVNQEDDVFSSKLLQQRFGIALARTVVQELDAASVSESAELVTWLGKVLSASSKHLHGELLVVAQGALLRTLQRVRTDHFNLRVVLKALARLTGFEFLHLPFLEMATSGGTTPDSQCIDEAMIVAVAETWAWSLSESERQEAYEIKLDFIAEQDADRLQKVLDLTFAIPDYIETFLLKKDVARHCCQALGSLKLLIKDSLDLVKRTCDWIIEASECFIAHPDVVHEGLTSLVAIIKERSEIFGVDVSRTDESSFIKSGPQDTLAAHLRDRAMGIAYTCEAKTDFSDATVKQAYKLLVHTHPFSEVIRFVLISKKRPQREMLWAVLDESNASLTPAIMDWIQVAPSRCSKSVAGIEATNCPLPSTLLLVKTTGGVGIDALRLLEQTLQRPPGLSEDGNQSIPQMPRLPFLFEWARSAWRSHHQDRFFLLGILFSPRLLVFRLAPISGDQIVFTNVARSLLDLNCLERFERPLQRELAEALINLEVPQTPNSCVAWVETLQICLAPEDRPQGPEQQPLEDRDLAELAIDQLMAAIHWATGREGWTGFIHQVFFFVNRLQTAGYVRCQKKAVRLRELAGAVQANLANEVQAHMQANVLLSQLDIASKER